MSDNRGSVILEMLDRSLFPERYRRFITFRMATVFVAIVAVGSTALDFLNRPRDATTFRNPPEWMHSPAFILLHAIVLVLGFWLLYRTREKKQYYRFRVFLYGMLLGGLLGEVLDFLLPRL